MFIDKAKIIIKSGDGGDGIVSFRREKYVPAGGPDGGNGGDGGNVIFKVDEGASTLANFRYKRKYKAGNGQNGGPNKRTGKKGEDIVIKVPLGTVVYDRHTNRVLADMVSSDDEVVVLKGGKGGRGNMNFATSTRQVPNFAKAGEKGEELEVVLELKLLADVGLAGWPNVGKSTLLAATTDAKPEIANYHFTTINPILGVVTYEDKSYVMADIPGLIEGASEGVGLGHQFLRHIERTRLIIHVIDMAGTEGRDPFEDFLMINNELEKYNEELAKRPQIIAANKMDVAGSDENLVVFREKLEKWIEENDRGKQEETGAFRIFEISALKQIGTRELVMYAGSLLEKLPQIPLVSFEEEVIVHKAVEEEDEFAIHVDEEGKYMVEGSFVDNLLRGINFNDYESMAYFQNSLRRKGVIDELKDMGINEGDIVKLDDIEFEYIE